MSTALRVWNPPRWHRSGVNPVTVGKGRKVYLIPRGWRAAHPQDRNDICYLLGRDGIVYALTEAGETAVPKRMQRLLRSRFFPEERTAADRETQLVAATQRLLQKAGR